MRWDVSTAVKTLQLKGSSVPDIKGAPMNVSAIINYQVVDAIAATYNVENKETFIQNQGLEVLRRVCAQFPYKCQYGTDEPSLMADGKLIG